MQSKVMTIVAVMITRSIHGITDNSHWIIDTLYSLAKSSQTLTLHHRVRRGLHSGFPVVNLTHCVGWGRRTPGDRTDYHPQIPWFPCLFAPKPPVPHPSPPPLTPTHFKKLSLFHSSLLTSIQTCVKLEYMRLKGSLTGQHPSTSSPCMRSV